jgi:arsenite methyltransferase
MSVPHQPADAQPLPAPEAIRQIVRERYGAIARRVQRAQPEAAPGAAPETPAGCCLPPSAPAIQPDPITANLYSPDEAGSLPAEAVLASLGCGNPVALAELRPGEVVLDLGSGGGIDVLLSARRVGPTGFVYGLDMTDEMLALAKENRRRAGAENVRFLKGTIEQVPLPDESVDVVISNCVINLSADKDAVLREAYRVLRPGGRFAVSDIVVRRALPAPIRRSMAAWAGCIAGALHQREYLAKLAAAGFAAPEVQISRELDLSDLTGAPDGACASCTLPDDISAADARRAAGALASAFIRATKPRT